METALFLTGANVKVLENFKILLSLVTVLAKFYQKVANNIEVSENVLNSRFLRWNFLSCFTVVLSTATAARFDAVWHDLVCLEFQRSS